MAPPVKKRRLDTQKVEEITFDPASRQEYLTGFHKRKLQRAKHAKEIAEKRARAEKIEQRKKLREERKADLERHVREVNAMLKPVSYSSNDEGPETDDENTKEATESDPEVSQKTVDHEAEYTDEEKYTTVTVETLEVTKDGLTKEQSGDADPSNAEPVTSSRDEQKPAKSATSSGSIKKKWTKDKPSNPSKLKKKRKKFRYESKAERKMTRAKERSKNSKQAQARREQ